jgi:hypothetical protein
MPVSPLKGLVIRTSVLRRADLGFIFAADPDKDRKEIPHAIVFKWKAGVFNSVDVEFDVHTACFVQRPAPALVYASEDGNYAAESEAGVTSGDIVSESQPRPKKPRTGGIRRLEEITGKAYAVGLRGLVYRLDNLKKWTRIDEGLPSSFDVEAIHGFGETDVYAVGNDGQLWHFDGKKWSRGESPTDANLNAIRCAGDGEVYCGGNDGILIRGRLDEWEVIDQDVIEEDIWDLEWFNNAVYVSTLNNVYRLTKQGPQPVDFGKKRPKSTYQLTSANGVMWSNGEYDITSFDGRRWTRVV